jgi:O-antigen ligase
MADTYYVQRDNRRLQYIICALLVWLPLPFGSNDPWSNGLLILVIAIIGCKWSVSHASHQRTMSAAYTAGRPMIFCLMMVQAWVFVQWAAGLSSNPGETILYLLLGLSYAVIFAVVLDVFNSRDAFLRLLVAIIISGSFQAFLGAADALTGLDLDLVIGQLRRDSANATGTFVNRNHLAGYLEMSLACGVGLLLALRDGRQFSWRSLVEMLVGPKARIRLALVIMVIGLVMTHSRMGNVAFFSSLAGVGGVFVVASRQHRLRYGLILASLIVIDVLIVSQYFGLDRLQQRLFDTQLEDKIVQGEVVSKENVQRDDVYAYALPLVKESGWQGSGAGSFEVAFMPHAGPDIEKQYDHAHNDYLQFMVEYGIVGCVPLAVFMLLSLYHSIRALINANSYFRSGAGFGGCMGTVAILIHSGVDFNLQIPANAATFIVVSALGLLARFHNKYQQDEPPTIRARPKSQGSKLGLPSITH